MKDPLVTMRDACPHCQRPLDSVMQLVPEGTSRPPGHVVRTKPGDVGVCIGCAGLHVFTLLGNRRKMNYAEELELTPKLRKMVAHARASVRALPKDP